MTFRSNASTQKIVLIENSQYSELELVAYWNEGEKKVTLDTRGLPKPPDGKCFQLWADVEGEMLSVGVLEAGSGNEQKGTFHPHAESLNITLEDAPGSDHATVTALVTSAEV